MLRTPLSSVPTKWSALSHPLSPSQARDSDALKNVAMWSSPDAKANAQKRAKRESKLEKKRQKMQQVRAQQRQQRLTAPKAHDLGHLNILHHACSRTKRAIRRTTEYVRHARKARSVDSAQRRNDLVWSKRWAVRMDRQRATWEEEHAENQALIKHLEDCRQQNQLWKLVCEEEELPDDRVQHLPFACNAELSAGSGKQLTRACMQSVIVENYLRSLDIRIEARDEP